jgi:hypothetical protein
MVGTLATLHRRRESVDPRLSPASAAAMGCRVPIIRSRAQAAALHGSA